MTKYGKVGLDVGNVGRWMRLAYSALILIPIIINFAQNFEGSTSLSFLGESMIYLVGIVVAYTAAYYLLGERLLAKVNPWINTLLFVGPAFVIAWWNIAVPSSFASLPAPLGFGMAVYIGVSFVLQWKIRYGGCEVVSLPIILSRRRYPTYCIPLVAVDASEKQFMDSSGGTPKLIWGATMVIFLAVIMAFSLTTIL